MPVPHLHRFADLTRDELGELAPVATVVIPTGSTEQHRFHLPTSADTAMVTHAAERAAASQQHRCR